MKDNDTALLVKWTNLLVLSLELQFDSARGQDDGIERAKAGISKVLDDFLGEIREKRPIAIDLYNCLRDRMLSVLPLVGPDPSRDPVVPIMEKMAQMSPALFLVAYRALDEELSQQQTVSLQDLNRALTILFRLLRAPRHLVADHLGGPDLVPEDAVKAVVRLVVKYLSPAGGSHETPTFEDIVTSVTSLRSDCMDVEDKKALHDRIYQTGESSYKALLQEDTAQEGSGAIPLLFAQKIGECLRKVKPA